MDHIDRRFAGRLSLKEPVAAACISTHPNIRRMLFHPQAYWRDHMTLSPDRDVEILRTRITVEGYILADLKVVKL